MQRVAATVHIQDEETHFVTVASSLAELEEEVRTQFFVEAAARVTVHASARSRRGMSAKAFAAAIAAGGRSGWDQLGTVPMMHVRVHACAPPAQTRAQ